MRLDLEDKMGRLGEETPGAKRQKEYRARERAKKRRDKENEPPVGPVNVQQPQSLPVLQPRGNREALAALRSVSLPAASSAQGPAPDLLGGSPMDVDEEDVGLDDHGGTTENHDSDNDHGGNGGGNGDDPPDPDDPQQGQVPHVHIPDWARFTPEWLAEEFTKIKIRSDMSDASMERVCSFVMKNLDGIRSVKDNYAMGTSYRHSMKTKVSCPMPKILCGLKAIDLNDEEAPATELRDLEAIPRQYISPTLESHMYVLWLESYTSLAEIKRVYRELHPDTPQEEQDHQLLNCILGIDGVQEADSGSRTLTIVTLMIGGCIFPWRCVNPLKKDKRAKMSVEELLRYGRINVCVTDSK